MSRSRSALSALKHARTYRHPQLLLRTLLPFLYQTPTIQQWHTHTLPIPRQYHSGGRRTTLDEDLPFERPKRDDNDELPPAINESTDEAGLLASRKSTVTDVERRAFQKLYETLGQDTRPGGDEDVPFAGKEDGDMVFDEYYEEEEGAEDKAQDNDTVKVEEVFDKVISRKPLPRAELKSRKAGKKRPEILKTLAEKRANAGKTREEVKEERDKLRVLREEEKMRIMALMDQAQTDVELWRVLQTEVLEVIKALDLDQPVPGR